MVVFTAWFRWIAVLIGMAIALPAGAAADVIILNDGQKIETPRAIVEGTQVFYLNGDEVLVVPHARVREIHRGDLKENTGASQEAPPVAVFYRLAFKDGRTVQIDEYDDGEDVIRYTKYGVRVTIDKSGIETITRVSGSGEDVVFRHGAPPASPASPRRSEEDAVLQRLSDESRDRALYKAVVDDKAMMAAEAEKMAQKKKGCHHECLQAMVACRRKCAAVLDTLKKRQVPEDDPAYIMVKNEVVAPCAKKCLDTERRCLEDCRRSIDSPQP
jgi:hypothetical protein